MRRDEALQILGVDAATAPPEIKARYRRLVKTLHPDSTTTATDRHSIDLARLVEAYRTLVRPEGRRRAPRRPATSGVRRGPAKSAAADSAGSSRPTTEGGEAEHRRLPTAEVLRQGAQATTAGDRNLRLAAVRTLSGAGRYAAATFLKQAMFDADPTVAVAAAAGFPMIPGARIEQDLIELFDQLSRPQRRAILAALPAATRWMPHLVAYAAADPDSTVAAAAQEMIR